jgi:gliding motility-associated-like protein
MKYLHQKIDTHANDYWGIPSDNNVKIKNRQMKRFCNLLALILILQLWTSSVLADIFVAFDISKPDNSPFSNLEIKIYKENGSLLRTLVTNEKGQYVTSLPEGNYAYETSYGDWPFGYFTTYNVTPNDEGIYYTWVNVDYRTISISCKNHEGKPTPNEEVKIFKINNNGSETFCISKRTDENGLVEFILPEGGKYKYAALYQQEIFEVTDENIFNTVDALTNLSLIPIHYGFKKGGAIINVLAGDIDIFVKKNESWVPYGRSRAGYPADTESYNIFESPVSCVLGNEYKAVVNTKEFGSLTKEYTAYMNAAHRDTVYFIIPDESDGFEGGGGGGKGGWPPSNPDGEIIEYRDIRTHAYWKNSEDPDNPTPIPDMLFQLSKQLKITDTNGADTSTVKKDSWQTISVSDQKKTIVVDKDTTVNFYLDNFILTNFAFRLDGVETDFGSIGEICVRSADGKIDICTPRTTRCFPNKFCPVPTIDGDYSFSFEIDEKYYQSELSGNFSIPEITDEKRGKDTTIYVDLVSKFEVKFILLDADSTPMPYIPADIYKYIDDQQLSNTTFYDDSQHGELETDATGIFFDYFFAGKYQIKTLDSVYDFTITADTTITLVSRSKTRKVYFQFLHEGVVVYPQIMRMDILQAPDSIPYSYLVSTIKQDAGGADYRVLSEPAKCFDNEYIYKYLLVDYNFNGIKTGSFDINFSSMQDTIIYIVLPVKRNVEITLKDQDGELIQGVLGAIYKYNEDGTLNPNPIYDDASHNTIYSNDLGIIMDQLLPGKYQLSLPNVGIVRDFVVDEFDAGFEVTDGVEYFKTTFKVREETEDGKPVPGISLKINKEDKYYSEFDTDANGEKTIDNEAATYTYFLEYGGTTYSETYTITKDTTIYIIVPKFVTIEEIAINGCNCLQHGETIQLTPQILPEEATIAKPEELEWTIDNTLLATIYPDGKIKANTVGLEGEVNVIAKAKDGSQVVSEKFTIQIKTSCEDARINLSIGETGQKELQACDGTVSLITENSDRIGTNVTFYVYQYSTEDEPEWKNITTDPVRRTILDIQAEDYYLNTTYFRVIAAETEEIAKEVASGNIIPGNCYKYGISTPVKLLPVIQVNSIAVEGCNCVRPGETVQLAATILPLDATCNDITWSVETTSSATISQDGKLTIDKFFSGDKIKVVAVSADNKTEELTLDVNENCRKLKANLSIAELGVKDTLLKENKQIPLLLDEIQHGSENFSDYWFIYQSSTDTLTWTSISEATQSNVLDIMSGKYRDLDTYFRVLISTSKDAVKNLADGQDAGNCISDGVSSSVLLYALNLTPVDWPEAVCASDNGDLINLKLSQASLGSLYDNATIKWYKKGDNDPDFIEIPEFQNLLDINTLITEKTLFKITIENGTFENQFIKEINYISSSDFKLYADKEVVCYGEIVELSVDNTIPLNSYAWFDGTTAPTNKLFATEKEYWAILNACPTDTARITLIVDDSLKISLVADPPIICGTETTQVELLTTIIEGEAGTYTWRPANSQNTPAIQVMQDETTTYSVTVETRLKKCPAVTKTVEVKMMPREEIPLDLNVTGDTEICQDGTFPVTLRATSEDPQAKFLWWDSEGVPTNEPVRVIYPDENMNYFVTAITEDCTFSETKYSGLIRAGKKTNISITAEPEVVDYGEEIRLKAVTDQPEEGPFFWYATQDGEERLIGETDEPEFTYLPTGTQAYSVKIDNGETCGIASSNQNTVKLTDMTRIPTAFTPHDKDGLNDDFMPGYEVTVFDRYGNLICDSTNGWNGMYRGKTADAGVYVYALIMKDGRVEKGTIEIVRLNK